MGGDVMLSKADRTASFSNQPLERGLSNLASRMASFKRQGSSGGALRSKRTVQVSDAPEADEVVAESRSSPLRKQGSLLASRI